VFSDQSFLQRWVIGGLGLLIAIAVVPGLHYSGGILGFVILALIFGLVNALLKPLLTLLTCPLVLLTLGLFLLVINGLLLMFTGFLGQVIGIPFHVAGFASAFLGGILISLVSMVAASMFKSEK
jgi:putative membrane protein